MQRCRYKEINKHKKSVFFREVRIKMAVNVVKKNLLRLLRERKFKRKTIGIHTFQKRLTFVNAVIRIQT